MSVTYNESASLNSGGGGAVSGNWQDVGNNDLQINQSIAANATNTSLGIVFDGTNLQAVLLVATQNVTLTINEPSGSSPFATINLKANIPYLWSASAGYFSNPLNTNVTAIYATTTSSCTLKGRILTN